MTKDSFISRFKVGICILLAGLLIGGILTGKPPFYMIAAFVAVVTWSAWNSTPHIKNAAQAYKSGKPIKKTIHITIEQWSDSQSYYATIDYWKFEFIPSGWTPVEGIFNADLYYLDNIAWPALAITQNGILFPRGTPEKSNEYC